MVFFIPLVSWDGFLFASTFTKTLLFITAIDVALIFWLPLAFGKFQRFWRDVLSVTITLFLGIAIIASVIGVNLYQSIWSNYERMMGLWTLAHVVLFFFMIITIADKNKMLVLLRVAMAAAFIVALVGTHEMIAGGGMVRVESTLRNSAFLASYLLLSSFITLWLLLRNEQLNSEGVFWGIAFLTMVATTIFTGTRGAIIAIGIGLAMIAVLFLFCASRAGRSFSIPHTTLKKITISTLIFIILGISLGVVFHEYLVQSTFDPLSRLASISISERTLVGRVLAWDVAWYGWKERFLFGWGFENYNLLFNRYYDSRLYEQEPWFDRAHNFIFDIGSTIGIVGLFAYLNIFAAALWILFTQWKAHAIPFWSFAIFLVALFSHLLQNFFVFDTLSSLIVLFIIFAAIHIMTRPESPRVPEKVTQYPWLIVIAVLLVIPLWYVGTWKPASENYYGKLGYDAFAKAESDDSAIWYTEQALSWDTYGNIDVRRGVAEYVFEYLKQGGRVRDEKSLRRVIEYAIEKMEDNIRERPRDVKWYMYQGQLYNLHATVLGKPDPEYAAKAEKRFLEAAAMSPQRMQIYLEIAQARKVQGNISGVWNAIDRAETLVPEYGVPHVNALVHAIDLGDRSREAQELSWLDEHLVEDRESIRDAYYRVGRFDDAAVTEISIIKNREHDTYDRKELAKEYKNLAIFYKEAGKFTQAREAALRVVELDQSQKASAEAFIQSLKALER